MHTIVHTILRYKERLYGEVEDVLAMEEPLEVAIVYEKEGITHRQNVAITMRTPGDDAHLVAGFLFTEGILTDAKQIDKQIQISDNQQSVYISKGVTLDLSKLVRHFYTTSSCGVCGKSSIEAIQIVKKDFQASDAIQVEAKVLLQLNDRVRNAQAVFDSTGGLHASALFHTNGELLALSEDVGRHNALDKLIGNFFLNAALPLNRHILFLSGRASFELIQKAAMAEIPIVCALGAPSSLAVQLAQSMNMTLIGFLKSGSFNVYCGAERLMR